MMRFFSGLRVAGPLTLIFLFGMLLPARAQTISGSIGGRVIDQQGATVAGATVTATDTAKNVSNTGKTSAAGDFAIVGLQPGSYRVTVEVSGFKKLTRTAIQLDANDKLSVGDLILEVGAVTESVEVSGTAVLLQTESVERSSTISGKQLENIEVNGRNALDLTKLVPGVATSTNTSYAVGSSGTGANNFAVNGARPSQNQLTINGIGNVDTGNNGGMNVSVSIDSIAEFKILTGDYQAEYGRSVGAQISLVTKTGSESFHGSGYLYHRNDSLNANTFLNNARTPALPRPLFRYNDPGYTVGGPVYIPKLFERTRHKVYFFLSQEWQEQLSRLSRHLLQVGRCRILRPGLQQPQQFLDGSVRGRNLLGAEDMRFQFKPSREAIMVERLKDCDPVLMLRIIQQTLSLYMDVPELVFWHRVIAIGKWFFPQRQPVQRIPINTNVARKQF
jgi:hypothetical protein